MRLAGWQSRTSDTVATEVLPGISHLRGSRLRVRPADLPVLLGLLYPHLGPLHRLVLRLLARCSQRPAYDSEIWLRQGDEQSTRSGVHPG